MLTEQEIMNNAFKEMLSHEDSMAKKCAQLSEQMDDPKLKQLLKGMEQGSRNHFNTLSQTMSRFGII